jgi:hypothetical protein
MGETPTTTKKMSRLEKLEQKKAQLEHQIKAIQARENEKVRKARTRRLIQIGAIAEKYLQCPQDMEPAEFEQVMKQVVATLEQAKKTAQSPALLAPSPQQQEEEH